MIREIVIVACLLSAGCSPAAEPISDDSAAIAAAERKAIADTDAARRDAAAMPAEQSVR